MRFRYALPLLLLVSVLPAAAQVPCEDGGAVDPSDGQFYPCENASFLSRLPLADLGVPVDPSTSLPYRGNDIWGWTDPETDREYALVGNQSGMYIADVTDPLVPLPLGRLPTETSNTTWRDIKTYETYAYVVADGAGSHGLQVFDLTRLRGLPPDANRVFTPDTVVNDFGSAHNIFVHEETGYLYVAAGGECNDGPLFFDLADPAVPVLAGCYSDDGYTHDLQCVLYHGPDPDYQGREVCLLSNEDALTIIDATDKANPTLITQAFYPSAAYVHQGWFDDAHRFWYQDDELDEIQGLTPETRTIRFDMTDLDAPAYRDAFLHGTQSTDHNLYTRDELLFLSNNTAGLRVLQVLGVDPEATVHTIGYFDTYPENDASGFQGAWSVYPYFPSGNVIVSDRTRGLFVVAAPLAILIASEPVRAPEGYRLSTATPNPFVGETRLTLSVDAPQHVRAVLYDARGRRVALLFEGEVGPGASRILRIDGVSLAPGTYFLRLDSDSFSVTRPLVRAR